MVTLQTLNSRFLTKILVLKPIEYPDVQKVYPSTSLDESSFESDFETDRSICLEMRVVHLQIKVRLQKERLFDDFLKETSMEKQIWQCLSQMMIYII